MLLDIDNQLDTPFSDEDEDLVRSVAQACLDEDDIDYETEISIVITDNLGIKQLNKQYRGIDNETDVLSFPLMERDELQKISSSAYEVALGDIVISYEKMLLQALEYGHSSQRELGFLTAHGMLHLLGYDHEDPADEIKMMRKQEEILSKAGLTR